MFGVKKYFKKLLNLFEKLKEFETIVYNIDEDSINPKKIKDFFEKTSDILKPGQTVGYVDNNDMSAHEYRNRYQKELKKLNNEEVIEVFNRSLHTAPCYGVIIQAHQGALLNEFERREIDYSAICNGNSVTFSKNVKLEGNQLSLL